MKRLALPHKAGKRGNMLSLIRKLFTGEPSEPLPDPDARLALGALLVRLIKADENSEFDEKNRIDALLAHMNGLGPVDAAKMRATCEKIEAEAPTTRKFATLIRETVSFEARVEAQEALWHIILTNGRPSAADLAMTDRARDALGLSKADYDAAKARALPL